MKHPTSGGQTRYLNSVRSQLSDQLLLDLDCMPSGVILPLLDTKTPSPSRPFWDNSSQLIDPVLVFIKPYRLRGDILGLKQAVLSSFDPTTLALAHKSVWDTCKVDLEQLGLT